MARDGDTPQSWTWKRLGEVARVLPSNVDKKISGEEHAVRLCNYTDVYYNRYIDCTMPFAPGSASEQELRKFQVKKGDVLITKDSEDRNDIAVPSLVTEDLPGVLCGYHLAIVRPKNGQLDGGYLSALLQYHPTRHMFSRLANGVTRFGLTVEAIKHARFLLPPLAEQRGIFQVIKSSDRAISLLVALIKRKVVSRRVLLHRLVLGKARLPSFDSHWRTHSIGNLLKDVSRYESVKDDERYKLVSIRRRSGGLFNREALCGRDIGYSKLKTIRTGDFVIARRQVVHGAMAMAQPEFDGAFVSDAYATLVVRPKAGLHMPFFDYLSQTPLMYYKAFRCSYGVALEKLFFNLDWFLKEEVAIPPTVEEQERIASVLAAADREIALLRRELDLLRRQKRGLMQKLLTGQIRVKP